LTQVTEHTPLAYATPTSQGGSPVWAGFWIVVAGLALIFFGGCFCIGVLMLISGPIIPAPLWTWRETMLMFLLYAFAFACFAGGTVTLVIGIR
jgi:hypothetical protein